ncbi:sensor domain-containing protein [Mycolicibacterium sp. BiH015]|uniref:sensor domain-containing protein n=1 Tax=Mycolicibacterium sp. BiH015 TaxID=3018808 RepID=UPI0022E5C5E5|nr:sensor domain-containing protein [Mycolicibacterium sp. BiH015]MDA2893571.1 sensor domain-containing protein [Mycolicibacterium sp. BiH015]
MTSAARRVVAAELAVIACLVALLGGCVRHVDQPQARPESLAAPIGTLQVVDLLSPKVIGEDGNLFVVAEPQRCAGLAREVDPPFIEAGRPLATDGGHWTSDDGQYFVEEMVAVYRAEFDPAAALQAVREAIDECTGTTVSVTTMRDRLYAFEVQSSPTEAPDGSVLWSLRAFDWNCDNLFVAAHNAAIEITTCGASPGFDVVGLAQEALERIERLANTTA